MKRQLIRSLKKLVSRPLKARLEIQGGGGGGEAGWGYKPNDHPWWRNGYFLKSRNASKIMTMQNSLLSNLKSNCWIIIPWNAVSRTTCEDYLPRMCDQKNTKLTSFGFFLRYCTMDCLNSPCEILIAFTILSCSDNA